MADIAKVAGVSKTTVSRYFNGGYVKEETRQKIEKIVKEYDYEPNVLAANLKANKTHSNATGCMILRRGIPAAFIESNSYLSPKLPNVISAARRMARGRDIGIRVRADRKKNCANTLSSSPFPTSSSTYFHKNCIMKMNRHIKNVPAKSNKKLLRTKISNFLIRIIPIFEFYSAKIA